MNRGFSDQLFWLGGLALPTSFIFQLGLESEV